MKRLCIVLCLVMVNFGVVFSMSDCPDDDIVVPKENYEVEITDIDGVVTKGANITFECNTFITAKRGATTIFIPFDRIQEITMLDNNQVITKELAEVSMTVVLVDGSSYESKGASHQELTGLAGFGKFRIRLDHVKKIKFIQDIDTSSDETEPASAPVE